MPTPAPPSHEAMEPMPTPAPPSHEAMEPIFGIGLGPRGADPEVAYGVAFAIAAAEAFQQPFLFERIAFLDRFPGNEAKSLGVEWGLAAGRRVLELRTDDGSEPSETNYYLGRYRRRTDSLRWRPTGPFYGAKPGPAFASFDRGLYPGHGRIKPWTMTSGSQFRASDFHDPASPEFAEEFDMIRHLGGMDSTVRTADQSEIALFWEDGPWGATPPGHFLCIAMQLLQDRELSFIELARVFALIGMTQCDASISAWDNKYHHDIVRPESAVRALTQLSNRWRVGLTYFGQYATDDAPGSDRFDTRAGGVVGELIHGSMSFDAGAGYERLSSNGPDADRWYVSSGVRTKTGVVSLSLEGHFGRIEGEDEVSAAFGLQYDVARGLSANLGLNYAKARVMLDGARFVDTTDSMAVLSLRYSF